jgi:hypothetical protein
MSGGGGYGQYGSGSMNRGGMTNYQPRSQNPQFQNAMAYGGNRAAQMPNPGRYGNPYNGMPQQQPPQQPYDISDPIGIFRPHGQMPQAAPSGGGEMTGGMTPASIFARQPQQAPQATPIGDGFQTGGMMPANIAQQFTTRPMQQAPQATPMGNPFEMARANNMPGGPASASQLDALQGSLPQQQPMDSGLHPYQPQQQPMPQAQPMPGQNPNAAQMNAFSNSIASWQNPMGMQQAQMQRIGMNPQGSAQGGYFQGNSYVPNVGNQKNGLDDLARWGMNWDGSPKQTGPFIR